MHKIIEQILGALAIIVTLYLSFKVTIYLFQNPLVLLAGVALLACSWLLVSMATYK